MVSSENHQVDNYGEKPVRIIPGPVSIVQAAMLHKITDIREGGEDFVMSTQEYIRKFIKFRCANQIQIQMCESDSDSESFNKQTTPLKDLSGTISNSIYYKVLKEEMFGKMNTIRAALILHNVSLFSPKQSTHYLNITKKNMVKVFHKDGGFL
ncbi:hypothetical protein Tco_1528887 [Tanacetum coccineum]